MHTSIPVILPGKSIQSQQPGSPSPHIDAVSLVRKRQSAIFKDIIDALPKIRGNPRAPNHKGTYSEHFTEREQKISLGSTRYESPSTTTKVPSYFHRPADNLFNPRKV